MIRVYRPGPVVWAVNIAATCLVLFLFQKILWLVVPFILALIVYYALLPLKLVCKVKSTPSPPLPAKAPLP